MEEQKQNFEQLVRIIGADIDGNKKLYNALIKIKGVSYSFGNAICQVTGLDPNRKIGLLKSNELQKIEDIVTNPQKYGLPAWMLNRRKDYDDGQDKHISSTDIKFKVDSDIKRLKKIKAYRGMRHALGLPVRGQRTKANFRKGGKVGVKKKAGAKKGKV